MITISENDIIQTMKTNKERTTIHDVARAAGVSISTVSRVISKRGDIQMKPETRDRVLQAIELLSYKPSRSAQSLRRQESHLVAVLLPDISNPFFSLLARGTEAAVFSRGLSTLICDSDLSIEKENRHLDNLLAEDVFGVVFVPVGQPDEDRIETLSRHGIQVVIADRRMNGVPCVEAENAKGSQILAEYLSSLGYKRIAYLSGPSDTLTACDRRSGFITGTRHAGISPVKIEIGEFTYESGRKMAREILGNNKVDAIVAGNDLMAFGVLEAAQEFGLSVPRDLGVAGFDSIPWARILCPKLTTVEVPAREIGEKAGIAVLDKERRNVLLPVTLIPGETCRAVRGGGIGKQ